MTMSWTAEASQPRSYGTIGARIGAYFVDGLLAGLATLVGIVLAALVGFLVGQSSAETGVVVFGVGYILAGAGYSIFVWRMLAMKGYSPGKKLLGLRLVDAETLLPLGWWRVWLRGFVLSLITVLTFGIGAIVVAVLANGHPRKQGWHDLAVGSVVVPANAGFTGSMTAASSPAPPPLPSPTPPPPPSPAPPPLPSPAPPPPPSPAPPFSPVAPPSPPPAPPAKLPAAPPNSTTAPPSVPPGGLIGPPPGAVSPPPPGLAATQLPHPPPPPPPSTAPEGAVDESTRMAVRRDTGGVSWELAPTVGTARLLDAVLIIGRDPDESLLVGATVWSIDDPDKTVSKTHGVAGVDENGPWVEDWDSTNGIVVRRGDHEIELTPRVRASLEDGDVVLLGDFELNVRRNS